MSQVIVPPTPAATIAAGISLPLIGGVLVGLRFYFKRLQHGSLFVEDWLTLPAFVSLCGFLLAVLRGIKLN
jgi:hypothetical protein